MSKRALIVGARDERPRMEVDPTPSVATMEQLLTELGDWSIERPAGPAADRAAILAALERLAAALEPDDEILFYYFGHGGAVVFRGTPAWLGERPVFYLCGSRGRAGGEMTGVLDVELSAVLARMDEARANVSAILDCCHSAQIVRGSLPVIDAPSWLPTEDPTAGDARRHESLPRIVRLTGTSSLSYAYARPQQGGALGLLTEGFAAVVREAGAGVGRLCWDALAHRVRERAIQQRRCEEQWVTLAGPGERLVFRPERAELPRSVGFVAGREGEAGWLRAGLLQGIELGQEWGVSELLLDAELRPRLRARVRVSELELNRARVEAVDPAAAVEIERAPDGSSALLLSTPQRRQVVLNGPESLRVAVGRSALFEATEDPQTRAWASLDWTVEPEGVALQVAREDPALTVTLRRAEPTRAQAEGIELLQAEGIELLEDWARTQTLLTALERAENCVGSERELPLRVNWGRCQDGRDYALPTDGAEVQLRAADQLYFEVEHRGLSPQTWFVSAIEIGVDGRAVLLDATEPEGRAVAPRCTVYFGRRARRFKTGRRIGWSDGLECARPLALRVVFLMTLRPLELGHLVRVASPRWPSAKRPVGPVTRHRGEDPGWVAPELTRRWAWLSLRAVVSP